MISPAFGSSVSSFPFFEQFIYYFSHQIDIDQIHARIRFIKHYKRRILGEQLKEFGPLDLTAGKTEIDVPVHKINEVQFLRALDDPLLLEGAALYHADAQDVLKPHSSYRGRILKYQAEPK